MHKALNLIDTYSGFIKFSAIVMMLLITLIKLNILKYILSYTLKAFALTINISLYVLLFSPIIIGVIYLFQKRD